MAKPKIRIDQLLVERGLAESRTRAQALVMAGHVMLGDKKADKPGLQVAEDVAVSVKGQDHPWVSRGGIKLAHALEQFGIDVTGAVAIDVGSSTGGFTDVLLRRGARRVFAIDVGYGQLAWSLRQDPRVILLERENIRYLESTRITEAVDLAVIDTSFISLTLVLPKVRDLLGIDKTVLALIKPQFEVGKGEVGKGGVVREPEKRQEAIQKIVHFAGANGFGVGGVVESPITGPAGNVEYLIHLRTG